MIFSAVFLALVAFGAAVPITTTQQAVDPATLQKQREVILLLENIIGEIPDEHFATIGHTYDIEAHLDAYENPNLAKYLAVAVGTQNVQPKGTEFATTLSPLRQEVVLLTRILTGARDWQTLTNTAAWARVHLNEYQFLTAFIAAIVQRQDTQDVILPPIYEVLPQRFFDGRVIQEVQNIKSRGTTKPEGQTIIIPINYTSHLPPLEHRIAYFTEDIGLNNYYTFLQLIGSLIPGQTHTQTGTQQTGTQEPTGRGAQWLYIQQQLLARYNLERLGNNLGPIPELDLHRVNIPFKSHLVGISGLELPGRSEGPINFAGIRPQLYQLVRTLERRLINAIDSGHVITPSGAFLSLYQPQGLNILGNLIEGSGRSINPRYYGSLLQASKVLLAGTPEFDNIWEYTPEALELSSVAARDPALYVLLKQIHRLVHRYQESLPAHQWNDIALPGVQIEKVEVSKLLTYFEDWIVNLNNAGIQGTQETRVKQQKEQGQGQRQETQQRRGLNIKGLLKRLNHLPYEIQIVAQSQQNIPNAVVRVFLGPKVNHEGLSIDISANREDFVQLDQWVVDLVAGQNVITRNSQQSSIQALDHPSIDDMIETVEGAIQSQRRLYQVQPQQLLTFPARLSLPKGSYGGNHLQLLVVISAGQQPIHYEPVVPYSANSFHSNQWQAVGTGEYEQLIEQPITGKGQVMVDVVPDLQQLGTGINQGTWKWTNLYNKYQGYYSQPQWSHTLPTQQWQGQRWGVQGHGVQGQGVQRQGTRGQGIQGQGIQGQGIQRQGVQGQGWRNQGVQGQGWGNQGVQGQGWGNQGVQGQGWGNQGVQGQGWGNQGVQGQGQGVQGQGTQGQGLQGQGWVNQVQGQVAEQDQATQKSAQIVEQYYNKLPISQVIGGAISIDGKPFGWPLDRPVAPSAWSVPNIYVRDVTIYHEDVPVTVIPKH